MNDLEIHFEALADLCDDLDRHVQRQVDSLTDQEIGMLLEYTGDALEAVWRFLEPFQASLEKKRDPKAENLGVLDDALVNLSVGRDGLLVGRHVLAQARGHLLAFVRGKADSPES